MDMTESTAPRSDQINADDLIPGPRTYTIEKVTEGKATQPFDFHLIESPGRVYRPNKSMRRVMIDAWGPETSVYSGRRLTLYRDPDVAFGNDVQGGIKISHLSHIDKPRKLQLTVKRSVRKPHTVEPLPDDAPTTAPTPSEPTAEQVAECSDLAALRSMWQATSEGSERRAQIEARVAEVQAAEAE